MCKEETDIYAKMASKMFNIPYAEVTKKQRAEVKKKFYLSNYLCESNQSFLNITKEDGDKIYNFYKDLTK